MDRGRRFRLTRSAANRTHAGTGRFLCRFGGSARGLYLLAMFSHPRWGARLIMWTPWLAAFDVGVRVSVVSGRGGCEALLGALAPAPPRPVGLWSPQAFCPLPEAPPSARRSARWAAGVPGCPVSAPVRASHTIFTARARRGSTSRAGGAKRKSVRAHARCFVSRRQAMTSNICGFAQDALRKAKSAIGGKPIVLLVD